MSDQPPMRFETYLAIMIGFGLTIGAIAYGISSAIGATGNTRLIIVTQAPVFAILALWIIAIATGPHR